MSEKSNDKAWLETEMLIARSQAAAHSAGKDKELADLIAKYGGDVKNVPHEELRNFLGPIDGVFKIMRLSTTIQDLCAYFGLPFMETQTTAAVGCFIQGRLTDPEYYDIVHKLINGSDEDVRPGILKMMLDLKDITQESINAKTDTPEKRVIWGRWLDGDLFGPNKLND